MGFLLPEAELTPDLWSFVYIESADRKMVRVIAGWRGGYLGGDEWRFSTPLQSISETEEGYLAWTESGSSYYLRKSGQDCSSSLVEAVYNKYKRVADENDVVFRRAKYDEIAGSVVAVHPLTEPTKRC